MIYLERDGMTSTVMNIYILFSFQNFIDYYKQISRQEQIQKFTRNFVEESIDSLQKGVVYCI
jgi:hypothetical protein